MSTTPATTTTTNYVDDLKQQLRDLVLSQQNPQDLLDAIDAYAVPAGVSGGGETIVGKKPRNKKEVAKEELCQGLCMSGEPCSRRKQESKLFCKTHLQSNTVEMAEGEDGVVAGDSAKAKKEKKEKPVKEKKEKKEKPEKPVKEKKEKKEKPEKPVKEKKEKKEKPEKPVKEKKEKKSKELKLAQAVENEIVTESAVSEEKVGGGETVEVELQGMEVVGEEEEVVEAVKEEEEETEVVAVKKVSSKKESAKKAASKFTVAAAAAAAAAAATASTDSTAATASGGSSSASKVNVWAQVIQGILYYIDDNSNVYFLKDIMKNKTNPKIVGKYEVVDGEYSLLEYNVA